MCEYKITELDEKRYKQITIIEKLNELQNKGKENEHNKRDDD